MSAAAAAFAESGHGVGIPKIATNPPPPRLRLPANCRDVTAEKIGTVIGIIGATAAKATKPG
jgi:hypothetical protein